MSSNDLQALFSTLKTRSAQDQKSASPVPSQSSQPPSAAFASGIRAASTSTARPLSASAGDFISTASPNDILQNNSSANNATAQSLLNLLNFGNNLNVKSENTTTQQTNLRNATPPTTIPASNFANHSQQVSRRSSSTHCVESSKTGNEFEQELAARNNPLLGLLTRHAKQKSTSPAPESRENRKLEEVDIGRTAVSTQEDDNKDSLTILPGAGSAKPLFTYTNPFEALNASRDQTPKQILSQPHTPAFEFSTPAPGVDTAATVSTRKKLTPRLRAQRSSASPQPEQMEPTDGPNVAGSVAKEDTTSTQRQPRVETPAVAMEAEISELAALEAQEAKTPQSAGEVNGGGGDGSGEWEDADELSEKGENLRTVPVYNFPIKAFVSITLHPPQPTSVGVRESSIMPISRLKKDFDQLDRSLAAATSKYITYAFTKNGGLRIIRQDDGSDRHVFKNSQDRIFNVALCTTSLTGPPSLAQAVLGTGVSGTVYYATISKENDDLFDKSQLEVESLIIPPWPQADENTAGGMLKTRAKRSSRHPEFFAIGRGKSINIIWPATAMSAQYLDEQTRIMDIEKYYQDRPSQIQTGKAGKDFSFSEDDSMIVSLDKTGRLRFWDIRTLVDQSNATAARMNPIVIDAPVLSLSTVSPAEKSWPTSVLFLDKSRPYNRGGALRYVLVGLRQNHTLQLWDIALGKAVQEINFPHESETDGICSVNYHSASGIIVVGHPTRNSIFFIHLSAPRYALSSSLSQAAYVSRVAAKDSDLPKPESTACMSGIREISFAENGELRSIELLPVQKVSDSVKSADSTKIPDENAILFELYVAHSKGVTCLAINREDLGWNSDNKVIKPIDAQKEGLVSLKDLKLGSVIEETARSKSPLKEAAQGPKSLKKKSKKAIQATEDTSNGFEVPHSYMAATISSAALGSTAPEVVQQDNGSSKESKKNKKKALASIEPSSAKTRVVSPVRSSQDVPEGKLSDAVDKEQVGKYLPNSVQTPGLSNEVLISEIQKVKLAVESQLALELTELRGNISKDRVAQEQSSLSRQEAILRLVSTSLSTNVEKSLSRIIAERIQVDLLPTLLRDVTKQIEVAVQQSIEKAITKDIKASLPKSILQAFETQSTSRLMANSLSDSISAHLEKRIKDTLQATMTPLFNNVAQAAAEKALGDRGSRLQAQIQQLQNERVSDSAKLDKLNQALQGMANTLQAMSDAQVAFQDQVLQGRHHLNVSGNNTTDFQQHHAIPQAPASPVIARPIPIKVRSKSELELDEVANLMTNSGYEEGTIKWLQSSQPVQLFDEVFVRFTPDYLTTEVSPLVAFSVAVTVANALNTNIDRRLEWISTAFDAVDPMDTELIDLSHHAPALISSIIQKLESLYMTIAERQHDDPILKTIPSLVKKAREMRTLFLSKGHEIHEQ